MAVGKTTMPDPNPHFEPLVGRQAYGWMAGTPAPRVWEPVQRQHSKHHKTFGGVVWVLLGSDLLIASAEADVSRCHKNFWQVSAGVTKVFGKCRQVWAAVGQVLGR